MKFVRLQSHDDLIDIFKNQWFAAGNTELAETEGMCLVADVQQITRCKYSSFFFKSRSRTMLTFKITGITVSNIDNRRRDALLESFLDFYDFLKYLRFFPFEFCSFLLFYFILCCHNNRIPIYHYYG